jgi:drug/metabolite transporter (DMT)-like permease
MKPQFSYNDKIRARGNAKPTPVVVCLMAFLCILFGANTVAVKTSLQGFGPFTNAGIRFFSASLVIGLWARLTGRPLLIKKKYWPHVLFLTLLFYIQIVLVYLGMGKTLASRCSLIANLQPFFVLVFAHFFLKDDKITLKKFVGIMAGFAGVAVMFIGKKSTGGNLSEGDIMTGDLMIFGSVIVWAINAVFTKVIINNFRPYQLAVLPGFLSVPFLFSGGVIFDEKMIHSPDLFAILAMAYQSIVTASIGYVLWITLLKKYGAVTLHSYIFLMPVSGVFFGGLLLREPVAEISIVLSLAFIILGVILVHSSDK